MSERCCSFVNASLTQSSSWRSGCRSFWRVLGRTSWASVRCYMLVPGPWWELKRLSSNHLEDVSILIQIGIMRNHYRVIPYIPKMAIFIGIIMVDQWIEGYPILRHTQIFVAGKQQQHLPALVLAQPKSSCFFESG